MVAVGWGHHTDFVPHFPNPLKAALCCYRARFDFWTTVVWTSFGIKWRSALFRFSLFSQPFYVFLFQSSLTPLLHTLCFTPPLLCSLILTCCSRVNGKVPGYIWQLLKLEQLLNFGSLVWVYLPSPVCSASHLPEVNLLVRLLCKSSFPFHDLLAVYEIGNVTMMCNYCLIFLAHHCLEM